jgi:hypothetical protein
MHFQPPVFDHSTHRIFSPFLAHNKLYYLLNIYQHFCTPPPHAFVAQQPKSDPACLIVKVSRTHTHTPSRTALNEWSARPRGRYLHNTQQTKEKNIHALSAIQTRDPSNQVATDLRLRPHDFISPCVKYSHFDRFLLCNSSVIPDPPTLRSSILGSQILFLLILEVLTAPKAAIFCFMAPYKLVKKQIWMFTCRTMGHRKPEDRSLKQWYSTWGTRTYWCTRRHVTGG